jgi:uncharacterized membrane protein
MDGRRGDIHWYCSLAALLLAFCLVTLVGRLARHYIGKKLIETGDNLLLRVPLFNKIYSTIKQVKDAFAGSKTSLKHAVLVEFPHPGIYSIGFVTSEQRSEVQVKTPKAVWSVFILTTPGSSFLCRRRSDTVGYVGG